MNFNNYTILVIIAITLLIVGIFTSDFILLENNVISILPRREENLTKNLKEVKTVWEIVIITESDEWRLVQQQYYKLVRSRFSQELFDFKLHFITPESQKKRIKLNKSLPATA